MNSFFCAESSRKLGEDPIGWGVNTTYYLLLEYAQPWRENILESDPQFIPLLKFYQTFLTPRKIQIRPIFIWGESSSKDRSRAILLKQEQGFIRGYKRQEFTISKLAEVIPILETCFTDSDSFFATTDSSQQQRDILICTHGTYDKCCGKYGKPFYRQAVRLVQELNLEDRVRIWQATHFGGHRFAPTAIEFPGGRYYGRLDEASLQSLLTRQGDLDFLKKVYRGWGVLPAPVQILERELWYRHGWQWLDYEIDFQILDANKDETFFRCQITAQQEGDRQIIYTAEIVEDPTQNIHLRGGCKVPTAERYPQFKLQNLSQTSSH
ncbi:sucrase ferredoxin [Synechococcus sp. BDU 130192]|uniref:sucrase ferredoxin n=1 Tax=Synechococcus sp. BDU 130192 TaxID=2042059 RepID=UPI000C071CB4|nr:sucrase ferredoxin [Synechococcus sp. BDU 130192]